MISQYNLTPDKLYPIRNLMQVVAKRLKMQGFIVGDPNMGPKYFQEHQEKMQKWIADGSVKVRLSVTEGIDNAGEGLVGMLEGKNFGKAVLKIADLDQVSLRSLTPDYCKNVKWLTYAVRPGKVT